MENKVLTGLALSAMIVSVVALAVTQGFGKKSDSLTLDDCRGLPPRQLQECGEAVCDAFLTQSPERRDCYERLERLKEPTVRDSALSGASRSQRSKLSRFRMSSMASE